MNICLPRSALGRLDRKVEARVRSSGKILLQQKYLCSDQSPKCFLFPMDAFKLWCWRRLLGVPWRARRSHQSILKEINPEYLLEGLMLRLKLQYFGHLMQRDPDAGKDCRQEEKGIAEDETVGWHHQFNGHELEQAPRDCEGQGCLVHCSPCGLKKSNSTERLNNKQVWTQGLILFY